MLLRRADFLFIDVGCKKPGKKYAGFVNPSVNTWTEVET